VAENFTVPLTYEWNLNAQYEFVRSWVFELGYVGSRGIHQPASFPINAPELAGPTNPVNCGYNGGNPAVLTNCITTNTGATTNVALRVPYLGFAPSFAMIKSTTGDDKFNSLQATVRKQFSRGLAFQGAYTWSRSFAATYVANPDVGVNTFNPAIAAYGLNAIYHPQRLALSYNWNLPFGHSEGFKGKLVNGWIWSGVTTIQDGTPLTITDGRLGTDFGGSLTSRAQFCSGMGNGNVGTSGSLYSRVVNGYLNNSAFAGPTGACASVYPTGGVFGTGTGFGNSGQGIILGPGQDNWDMSLSKITTVGGLREGATLEFRTEFFNSFNHPEFSNPGVSVSTAATFGKITSSSVNPRLIQFALKYAF